MSHVLSPVRPEPVEGQIGGHPVPAVYMIDNRANLIVEHDGHRVTFSPAGALDLIAFLERTGYQAHAKSLTNGGAK
jgi:hypothetical protein